MANLTADTPSFEYSGILRKDIPFVITNGVQIYVGAIVKEASGYVTNFATGSTVLGLAVGPGVPGGNPVLDGFTLTSLPIPQIAPGNASTAAAGNANQVVVATGEMTIKRLSLTVAGTLAGTQADVGTLLYAADDNLADLTTTQPGSDKPFGEITAFYSASGGSATYDVLMYSYEARRAM